MRRVVAALVPTVALVVALGCGRRNEGRAADVYATPEVPRPASVPTAVGGGPPVENTADAALTPRYELDANAVLAEPPILPMKGDAQADGPSGGTAGASSDDRSPGASYPAEQRAGVEQGATGR